MHLVLIDKEELERINIKLDSLMGFINTLDEKTTDKQQHKKDWITLKEWCVLYSKGRSSWFDKYKDFIKYRMDGKLLIYKPAMDKYLLDQSIN